jgi:hypothetical protein
MVIKSWNIRWVNMSQAERIGNSRVVAENFKGRDYLTDDRHAPTV